MVPYNAEKSEWLTIAICFSLLFHASLLLIQQPTKPKPIEVELEAVQAESSGQSDEDPDVDLISPDGEKPCYKTYWGIGIVHVQGVVIKVAAGSPADRLGIKVRDIIIDDFDLRGSPFTNVLVKFIHDGKLVVKNTMREEICDN